MNDFSTNHASSAVATLSSRLSKLSLSSKIPIRHPTVSFSDGTICFLDVSRTYYFNVHKGLICRHSPPLRQAIEALVEKLADRTNKEKGWVIEGSCVLEMEDDHTDLARFLTALYDGVSELRYDATDFQVISSLLRLTTKYQVDHIRRDILRGMAVAWPKTLAGWEFREADATDNQGNYRPRAIYPHPILVINLARQTNAPDLLPSAFYDLCRCSASEIASGYTISHPNGGPTENHALSDADLLLVLKGREHASRFLSTFVVTELESRSPSTNCLYTNAIITNTGDGAVSEAGRKRICQSTFEATTFEVLRDVNGVVFHRTSDPLFAMMDADLMQASQRGGVSANVLGSPSTGNGQVSNGRLGLLQRACEPCRMEFSTAVDAAREEMWHRLPHWFGIDSIDWP